MEHFQAQQLVTYPPAAIKPHPFLGVASDPGVGGREWATWRLREWRFGPKLGRPHRYPKPPSPVSLEVPRAVWVPGKV